MLSYVCCLITADVSCPYDDTSRIRRNILFASNSTIFYHFFFQVMALTVQTRSIFHEQCRQTSVKGIPRLLRSRSRIMQSVWTISIFCFLSTAIYHSWLLIQAYLKCGTLTSLQERTLQFSPSNMASLKLPDMTFCNLNPLANEFHDVPDIPSMESYVNEIRKWSPCRRCSKQFNKTMEQLMGDLFSTMGYFTYVGAHNTQRIGHSQESFIAYCQFWETSGLLSRLAPCERIAHFDHYQDPMLYNCYTLKIPETISTSTSITGFILVFHLDNYGTNDGPRILHPRTHLGYMDGVIFAMHERGDPPVLEQKGIYIQAGLFSDMKVKTQHRKRLPAPYGQCKETTYENNERVKYSQDLCFFRCMQRNIIKECGCVDSNICVDVYSNISVEPCLTTAYGYDYVRQKYKCADHVKALYANHCIQLCPLPCEQYDHLYEVSNS